MKKRGRKGQVTVFIILGLIILLSVFIFVYVRSQTVRKETGIEIITEKVPDWARPVQIFVHDCMKEIAIDAFNKIGEHGGYINLSDYEIVRQNFNINPEEPLESDAVSLSAQDSSPVAYWWYMSTPNLCDNCLIDSLMPSLEEIEQQVNRYMNRELLICLDDFKSFKKEKYEFSTKDLSSETKVNLNDVDVTLNYQVEVKLADSRVSMEKFRIRLDLDFYHNFLLASLITNWHTNNMFLEDIVMYLIGIYSSTPNSERVPPVSWIDETDAPVTWEKDDVEATLKRDILSNIASIQVNHTMDAKHITAADPVQQGAYDVMFLDFLDINFRNSEVDFFYSPSWKFHFDITPRTGSTIKPVTVKTKDKIGFFPPTTTNYYEFFYDLSFPVIVIIRDNSSLKSEGKTGYTFMFALEGNIRDNKDLYLWNRGDGTIGPMDYSGVTTTISSSSSSAIACQELTIDKCQEVTVGVNVKWFCPLDNQDYSSKADCSNVCNGIEWFCPLNNQNYQDMVACGNACTTTATSATSPTQTPSLFCESDQRISGDIIIKTFDARTNDALPNVAITFGCGNYRKCPMESTDDNGIYAVKFPMCIGSGYLVLDKEGYVSEFVPDVSTTPADSKTYDVYLEPIREKDVEAYFINITNMFRIKRLLLPKTGLGVLDKLYRIMLVGHTSSGTPIHNEVGILPEIQHAIDSSIKMSPSQYDLSQSEAYTLFTYIKNAEEKINYSKSLIKGYEYWHDVDRKNAAKATFEARDAAEIALKILHNKDYVRGLIGDRFKGDITIDTNEDSSLGNILESLNKETKNIQFLKDSELGDLTNINFYKNNAYPLREGDSLTINYQKIKGDRYEQNIPQATASVGYGSTGKMSLVPGRYELSMSFQNEQGLTIPAKGDYPQTDYKPAFLGGAELNNHTGVWRFTKAQLDSGNKVRFYFLKIDDLELHEDISEIGVIANYSKRYRAYIEPEFLP